MQNEVLQDDEAARPLLRRSLRASENHTDHSRQRWFRSLRPGLHWAAWLRQPWTLISTQPLLPLLVAASLAALGSELMKYSFPKIYQDIICCQNARKNCSDEEWCGSHSDTQAQLSHLLYRDFPTVEATFGRLSFLPRRVFKPLSHNL